MMNRKVFSLVAAMAVLGALTFSSTAAARPASSAKPYTEPQHTDQINPFTNSGTIHAGPGPNWCESTGFEAVEANCAWELGWICGSTFTNCGGPPIAGSCTGNPLVDFDCCISNPNPLNSWWLSGSNQQCNEPHIDNINPAPGGGENHLRFQRDPAGGNPPGCTDTQFGIACRVNAFSPIADPYTPGPVTIEFDVAMGLPFGTPPFGSSMTYITVGTSNATVVYVYVHYYGLLFVYDYGIGGFYLAGYMNGDGGYNHMRIEFDPCAGTVEYYVDEVLSYIGSTAGGGVDLFRAYWQNQNIGGTHDWDNYSVVRHEACPSECGDGVIEGLEECEVGDDACCPGLCDPVTCNCIREYSYFDDCLPGAPAGRVVGNGSNGPYLTDGGLFSYTPDAEYTMFDTCGSSYDTEIIGLAPDCNTITFFNDECTGTPGYGGHPDAPCYVASGFPGRSCACVDTTPGVEETILVDQWPFSLIPPYCSSTVLNITKMNHCDGDGVMGGSCCNELTGVCTDDADPQTCVGDYMVFTENKSCELVGGCREVLGSCCNSTPGAGGACNETTMADCAYDWTPEGDCGTCEEVRGACCNALTGFCSVTLQSACVGADLSWTEGADCSEVTCNPALGACCRASEQTAECVQTSQAECPDDPPFLTWYRDTDCAEIVCEPLFTPIPTVSEWGLVIMALLLLVGGKVYFGRRQTAIA